MIERLKSIWTTVPKFGKKHHTTPEELTMSTPTLPCTAKGKGSTKEISSSKSRLRTNLVGLKSSSSDPGRTFTSVKTRWVESHLPNYSYDKFESCFQTNFLPLSWGHDELSLISSVTVTTNSNPAFRRVSFIFVKTRCVESRLLLQSRRIRILHSGEFLPLSWRHHRCDVPSPMSRVIWLL